MSHFTKVQARVRCLRTLKKALDDLDYDVVEGRTDVRGFGRQRVEAELVVDLRVGLDVGFVSGDEGYEAVADWDFVERRTGKTQEDFLNEVRRRYAYLTVKEQVAAAGFSVVEESGGAGEPVRLKVRRWS